MRIITLQRTPFAFLAAMALVVLPTSYSCDVVFALGLFQENVDPGLDYPHGQPWLTVLSILEQAPVVLTPEMSGLA